MIGNPIACPACGGEGRTAWDEYSGGYAGTWRPRVERCEACAGLGTLSSADLEHLPLPVLAELLAERAISEDALFAILVLQSIDDADAITDHVDAYLALPAALRDRIDAVLFPEPAAMSAAVESAA